MPINRKQKRHEERIQIEEKIAELDEKIEQKMNRFQEIRGCLCFPFIGGKITSAVVDDVFQDLRIKCKECNGHLDVIIDSGGGDINAAYNLSMFFRKYGSTELNFFVPRWAKSAATLLVCSGDNIFMSPVAELGPLDPQITELNPLEQRLEQFSPLHIESTLDMIRQEFENGNDKLAAGLIERLQFPLTLGGFIKAHEIAEQYLVKLLETRMFLDNNKADKIKKIAKKLTKGYADHGFCINIDETKSLGLNVKDLEGEELDVVWEIRRLNIERKKLKKEIRGKEVMEMIKDLPPEILEKISEPLPENPKTGVSQITKEDK